MPARKPTKLKLLQGTSRPHRETKNEPQPEAVVQVPAAPESLDEIGAREWARVCPILVNVRVLTDLDLRTLEQACGMYSRAIRADRALLENGETYTTNGPGGVMHRMRPEVRISEGAWRQYASAAAALGMTPRDRGAVSAVDVGPAARDKNFA